MQGQTNSNISEALTLHRKGFLVEAKAIYEEILRANENDANAIGLLGIIAEQEGNRAKAETLWRQSISLESDPFIYVRNLNNLAVTLLEEGRDAEARALLEKCDLPDWAGRGRPDERELKSIVSLTLCLQRFQLFKRARALLEPIATIAPEDKDAMRLLAALRFEDKDFGRAHEILKTIFASDDLWILTTRLRCAGELNMRAEAAIDHEKLLKVAGIYVGKNIRRDLKTVLVINSSDNIPVTESPFELHFKGNFPAQLALTMGDQFNFVSLLVGKGTTGFDRLRPDVVLSNMVNAEAMSIESTTKYDLSSLADSFGVPVINHPIKAGLTTRQRVAFSVKGLAKVVVPETIRIKADADNLLFQAASLEEKFNYPIIIRTTFNNLGVGMAQVRDRAELTKELQARHGRQIYVHEFIDNRTEEGYFRKFRACFIGEAIIPSRVDYSKEWKVRGRRIPERQLFYRQRLHLIEEERKILQIPSYLLTTEILKTLRDIRNKIPLDIFGMDFDILPNGKILFFEANASMNLLGLPTPDEADIRNPEGPEELMKATFVKYLRQRIEEGKPARLN